MRVCGGGGQRAVLLCAKISIAPDLRDNYAACLQLLNKLVEN